MVSHASKDARPDDGPTLIEIEQLLASPAVTGQLAEAIGHLAVTVQYRVEPDGAAWWWSSRGDSTATGVGSAEHPDVVVTCDGRTARRLLSGDLDVSRAFLLGQLRVEGDLGSVLPQVSGERRTRRTAVDAQVPKDG